MSITKEKCFLLVFIVTIFSGSCRVTKTMNDSSSKDVRAYKDNNTLTQKEKDDGWELLFNGQSLDKWRFFKGGEISSGWSVHDGIFCNSGVGRDHGGDIITKERFKDFDLYLEWKIDSMSNSGVFYHVEEEGSINAIYKSGPEYQLADSRLGTLANILASQLTGSNYAMNPAVGAKQKPLDEWNTTRILVRGAHVEHWLNGIKVVEYELWSDNWYKRKKISKWKDAPFYGMSKDGYIGLQDHGGLTYFRNIKIKRL